jgi:hypothetical protein
MASDLGLCCPLCLGVDDPAGMLEVKINHKAPPEEVRIYLCIDCFSAVIEAARLQNELLEGRGGKADETDEESVLRAPELRGGEDGSPLLVDEGATRKPPEMVHQEPDSSLEEPSVAPADDRE